MSLLTKHLIANDNPFPLSKNLVSICEKSENSFQAGYLGLGLSDAEAQAVVGDGPRADDPKLDQVLRGYLQLISAASVHRQRLRDVTVRRVGWLHAGVARLYLPATSQLLIFTLTVDTLTIDCFV